MEPSQITHWDVVNFSARCNVGNLIWDEQMRKYEGHFDGRTAQHVFEENPSMRRAPPSARVEDMFQQVKQNLPGAPKLLLCILAERKSSDIYDFVTFLSLFSYSTYLRQA